MSLLPAPWSPPAPVLASALAPASSPCAPGRGASRARASRAAVLAGLLVLATATHAQLAAPAEARTERLTIADPFIELHTGPGRGYPVFFVVPRGEAIEITLRRTDWYRVRTPDGKDGWVHRRQLETTITEAGGTRTFRDVLLDDYLARRVELGASWGRFEGDPMLKIWGLYRLSDTLRAEATVGQVQGTFSGSSLWHLNLLAEPWSDRRLSPTASVGFGNFRNVPNLSLVNAAVTNARLSNASLGVRWYLSDRFVLRADYTLYTAFVSDTRSAEYRAITGGLSFFF